MYITKSPTSDVFSKDQNELLKSGKSNGITTAEIIAKEGRRAMATPKETRFGRICWQSSKTNMWYSEDLYLSRFYPPELQAECRNDFTTACFAAKERFQYLDASSVIVTMFIIPYRAPQSYFRLLVNQDEDGRGYYLQQHMTRQWTFHKGSDNE